MKTPHDIRAIVANIHYKDWAFSVHEPAMDIIYLQITFKARCPATGKKEIQSGRKWLLSRHMTEGEIVQTALLAVLTAEEHEAREQFKFMGEPVFNPHFKMTALLRLAFEEQFELRAPLDGARASSPAAMPERQIGGNHIERCNP